MMDGKLDPFQPKLEIKLEKLECARAHTHTAKRWRTVLCRASECEGNITVSHLHFTESANTFWLCQQFSYTCVIQQASP